MYWWNYRMPWRRSRKSGHLNSLVNARRRIPTSGIAFTADWC
jgi:hypothetical protein